MSGTTSGNTFENFDLKAEAPEARVETIRFAFEFPQLLADFRRADAIANRAKRNSRRAGYFAVALVLAALLIASSAPVLHVLHVSHETELFLGYISAGLGLLGALIGAMGLRKGSARHVWLRHRVQTESLRLFHFQYMAAQFPELVAAGADRSRRQAYIDARAKAYAGLLAGPLANPDAELKRIAARMDAHDFRQTPELPLTGQEDPAIAEALFAAWRKLRLQWQLGYCEAMLSPVRTGKRLSARQTDRFVTNLGWALVAIVVALHVALVGVEALHLPRPWLETGVVWTALMALAVRALEEGLQPGRDVERYEQYRANIEVASERFEAAPNMSAKIEVLRGFERNSLEEMRIFMRTHSRSNFML